MTERMDDVVNRRALAIKAICANPRSRRELLWLRAKEKGDDTTARELERSEPALIGWILDVEAGAEALRSDAERVDWYARQWDERFEQAVRAFDPPSRDPPHCAGFCAGARPISER